MGLSVEIMVIHNNHIFRRRSSEGYAEVNRRALLGVGFVPVGEPRVEAEYFEVGSSSISNIDFEDITVVFVNIEVAGGRCNRTLGRALINVKRDLCPNYLRPVTVETFQTPVAFPAEVFTVEFGELQTDNVIFNLEVSRYLEASRNNSAVVDLQVVSDSSSEDIFTTVRFEYHPVPTLSLEFSNTMKPQCSNPQAKAPRWVIDSETVTNVIVYAKEEFPGIESCDDVTGNLTLSSYLGEDIPDSPLSICRDGCNLELMADEIVSDETGAVSRFKSRVNQTLVVGFPTLFPPHEKNVFVRMPVSGHKDVTLVRTLIFDSLLFYRLVGSQGDRNWSETD
jgi:hypothetical protein